MNWTPEYIRRVMEQPISSHLVLFLSLPFPVPVLTGLFHTLLRIPSPRTPVHQPRRSHPIGTCTDSVFSSLNSTTLPPPTTPKLLDTSRRHQDLHDTGSAHLDFRVILFSRKTRTGAGSLGVRCVRVCVPSLDSPLVTGTPRVTDGRQTKGTRRTGPLDLSDRTPV